jgi:hypothetical protein
MCVAAAISALLAAQARKVPARSSRQGAFGFAAAAFAVFALSNGVTAAGVDARVVLAASVLGVGLIAMSLLMLVRAYTRGEMGDKLRRAREMVAEERARTKERR